MDIQNFVFFDIETTGLPHEEYNKTRITEMCFVVVQKEHISLGVYPRVQNKLTFCFNPNKMISPVSSQITGLTNDLLERQLNFGSQTCILINKFLELQRKPICFVAHNGNHFDYPIFKTELYKAGCELIDDILCIDSLQMFRDLDKRKHVTSKELSQNIDIEHKEKAISQRNMNADIYNMPTQKNIPIELCDEFDELIFNVVDGVEMSTITKEKEIQNLNENTPKKINKTIIQNQNIKVINALQDHLYYTPPQNDDRSINASTSSNFSNVPTKAPSIARRQLNFGKQSYKLSDVYSRLTKKKNENAHLADQDVNMLIECAATLGQDFVDWANANAKKISDIPMMKPGAKLGL